MIATERPRGASRYPIAAPAIAWLRMVGTPLHHTAEPQSADVDSHYAVSQGYFETIWGNRTSARGLCHHADKAAPVPPEAAVGSSAGQEIKG